MTLVSIIFIVFILYIRTLNYRYVIDDIVKRNGYLYEVPDCPPPVDFFNTKPSWYYRIFMISMHVVNVAIIYMLWGWGPALIFAVHPQAVWGVAWVTGNYYATAAYFTLIAYFLAHQFPNILGVIVALPIFAAALNSTVCPINFPFLATVILWPWGIAFFWPLIAFLTGKRFKTGIKIRYSYKENKKQVDERFTIKRLILMTKVIARYTYDSIAPIRLGFFGPMGQHILDDKDIYNKYHSLDKDFWLSFLIIGSVFILGIFVNWEAILWFFMLIAIHSQFNITGQFYAQRYLYLPIIGLCVIAGQLLQPYPILLTIVVTYLVIRTNEFIPAWKHINDLYLNDIKNYSDSPQVYNNYAQWLMSTGNLKNHQVNELAMSLFKAEEIATNKKIKDFAIPMNIAAFFATVGNWGEAYTYTIKSMSILEPLGGVRKPLECLLAQKTNIEKRLRDATLAKQQSRGANISPHTQKEGMYGKRPE